MKKKEYCPEKGDVVYMDFDPAKGHEQKGRRPAVVISSKEYNQTFKLFFVVPITSKVKGYPFEVLLKDTKKISGVVLSDQVKSFDYTKRNVDFVEKVGAKGMESILEKLQTIF